MFSVKAFLILAITLSIMTQQSIEANLLGIANEMIKLIIKINIRKIIKTVSTDITKAKLLFINILSFKNTVTVLKIGKNVNPKVIDPSEIEIKIPKLNSFAL
ncbi:hypothetical protein EHE19_006125 [Ruminiclostridium herbifermentans]|uniref:Uncharacterized protein n=1 Tax=Ruminiclostridium herbifermentans TaxID=2488810 RepID=A0A7H1VRK4_9FIRM|nr:hypothetical protein EHE19_006125 [Ruminiclostridium herbifermentans]